MSKLQNIKPITSAERLANLESGTAAIRQKQANKDDTAKPAETKQNMFKAGFNKVVNKFLPNKEKQMQTQKPIIDTKDLPYEDLVNAIEEVAMKHFNKRDAADRAANSRARLMNLTSFNEPQERDVDDYAVEVGLINDTKEARAGFRNTARKNPVAVKKMLEEAMTKKAKNDAEHQMALLNSQSPKTLEERGKDIYNRLISGSLDREMAIMPANAF